jgi:glyoxylase I family protein
MFYKIHHIAIICSNYKKSKHFYSKILQLPIINETYREDRKSFKLDLKLTKDINLELFSFKSPPKRLSYPESCGLRHLAFAVNNIINTIKYLEENNIKCEPIRIDNITNKKFTFFNDPDNLPLEIYEIN